MSFAAHIKLDRKMLDEDHNIYPQLNPVEMPDVVIHLPADIMRLADAFNNEDLKDLQHELKSPGRPSERKVGRRLADLTADTRADLVKKGHLKVTGLQLYVTGGAVRDWVMNHFHQVANMPEDYDLATDAAPEVVKLIVLQGKRSGILPEDVHVTEVNDKFHNIIVSFGKNKYELSTFPFVNYENAPRMYLQTLKQNFTVNGLYYSIKDQKIIDFHNGLTDAHRKQVKPIGGTKKLKENPLYPLIAVRLHSRINKSNATEIEHDVRQEISNTRIRGADPSEVRKEFLRGLSAALDREAYIEALQDLGLLQQVFRGLKINSHPRIGGTKNPHIIMAQILEPNAPNFQGVYEHLHVSLSYPETEARSVVFLMKLPYYGDHNIDSFQQDRVRNSVSTRTIEDFLKLNKLRNGAWLKSKLLGDNFPRPVQSGDSQQTQAEPAAGRNHPFLQMVRKAQGDEGNSSGFERHNPAGDSGRSDQGVGLHHHRSPLR